jgi:hypothetical protein
MKIFNRMAFVWLLGVVVFGGVGCAKNHSTTAITGAALTSNKIDDDQDTKVDEADEARCTCHDDANTPDGSVADKDNSADESAAKADAGVRRHHHCECGDNNNGDHNDGNHQDGDQQNSAGSGGDDDQHTQSNLGTPGMLGK